MAGLRISSVRQFRLVPLGPTTAQRIQQQLLPMIRDQASALKDQDPHSLWSGGAGGARPVGSC